MKIRDILVQGSCRKWFFAAFLLFASIFLVRAITFYHSDPGHLRQSFQQKTTVAITALKSNVLGWANELSASRKGLTPEIIRNLSLNDRDELFIFILKNDTLIHWNDNTLVLPSALFKGIRDSTFASQQLNGWYLFRVISQPPYRIIGAIPVRSSHSFHNEFIQDNFSGWFPFSSSISISAEKGVPVYDPGHSLLFYLNLDEFQPENPFAKCVVAFLFFSGLLTLCYAVFLLLDSSKRLRKRTTLFLLIYFVFLVSLRLLQGATGFPSEVTTLPLFGPTWYSSSVVLPSLGDVALDILLLLVFSLAFYKKWTSGNVQEMHPNTFTHGKIAGAVSLLLLMLQGISGMTEDLVINSSVSYNLQNLAALTPESFLAILILTGMLLAFWLLSTRLLQSTLFFLQKLPITTGIIVSLTLVFWSLFWLTGLKFYWEPCVFLVAYLILYWIVNQPGNNRFALLYLSLQTGLFALFSTVLLFNFNREKDIEKMTLLADRLVTQRNPVTEVLYEQVERKLARDTLLNQWIANPEKLAVVGEDSMVSYLKQEYFNDYWQRYQLQITFCIPEKNLKIQPQGYLVNCSSYFGEVITESGKPTLTPNLFFLDYGLGKEYYLARYSGSVAIADGEPGCAVYFEFVLKNSYPDPGYPGLLMDKSRLESPILSDYSYALFQNGRLIRSGGTEVYRTNLNQYSGAFTRQGSFRQGDAEHFVFRINDLSVLLISLKNSSFLSLATSFSYLFLLYAFVALLLYVTVKVNDRSLLVKLSLRNRLQLIISGLLLAAMLIAGIFQVLFIIRVNVKKNLDNLDERAASVVIELQHKFSALDNVQDKKTEETDDLLVKIANVFFTDINLYDAGGFLVSTSRPQIFEEGLLSERMNAVACQKMISEKSAVFIHNETIGNMAFNSAYMPFFNDRGKLLGYVNLPYFARQDEARREISAFLVTFINIYIIIIILSILIIILISNYITAPLALLAGRLSKIRLGGANEKIGWHHQDEIGLLVEKYNEMIDELGRSAGLLAKSERESAWREMARQVAHEIKNPLTPMKLSTQYLAKAWQEKSPDWDQRLERFTRNMVEQIDALSLIASDFSDFARMQTLKMEPLDLSEVIRALIPLYQNEGRIRVEYIASGFQPLVMADKVQITRAFHNLINNAIQAIGDRDGFIRVKTDCYEQVLRVQVEDNGCGISAERADKIFQPDFTTKSGGMGLGLAIVKGIVEGMNGSISFTSIENQGTTFTIILPGYEETSNERQK